MRILIGLALLVALAAAITAGGFAVWHAYRGRRVAAVLWSVLAVVVFAGQCSAAIAVRPVQLSAARPTPAITPRTSATPTPVAAATPNPCRAPLGGATVQLPVTDFGRILADPGGCHVFVSSPASSTVVVLDYTGGVVKTLTEEYGADAMVSDGSALYVALTGTGAIDEIDLRSLNRVRTLATGLVKPQDLALAGGRLWTTSGNCAQWTVKLASVDPGTGAVKVYDVSGNTSLSYCAAFASGAAGAARLVAWDIGLEPANVTTLDVSSGTPVVVMTQREEILQNLQDGVVTPAGKLVTASGWPYEFDQWRLADLQQDGIVYPGAPYPVAVAVAAGRLAAGLGSTAGDGSTVRVFALDRPAAIASLLPSSGQNDELFRRGLALAPDGTAVFAVTGALDPQRSSVTVHVLPLA